METIRLGRTNIIAARSGFGALPIQRISREDAAAILRSAYNGGVNFFDTARAYTDSEEKLGYALSDVRNHIFLATKTAAKDKKGLLKDLETSLRLLRTDHIDIFQLHNPSELPDYDDPDSLYGGLLEAKQKGYIRFLGLTNHRLSLAEQAVRDGRFDCIQFPFSSLSSDEDAKLPALCQENDIGFLAMKGMSGGLITNAASTFAFLRQFDNVLPLWGIQRQRELDEFFSYEKNPPKLDEAMWKIIRKDRLELAGTFCRGCGYCQPCPAGIPIETAARISLLLTRSPWQQYMTDEFKAQMERINGCTHCNHCKNHCPYGLDTPNLLKYMLGQYNQFYAEHA
ncbi:aldo/keto reductase [Caproicibacter sp.]|uniref:aldo/keto reductase n=1 Tax=Caproicibacter sp. TaxID=2814884 RepID=UPI003989021E